jgi:hypothetical protein
MLFKSKNQPLPIKPPVGARLNSGHSLANGLCGYWNFDEGGGNVSHDLGFYGNGAFGATTAAPAWEAAGPNGVNLALVSANSQQISIPNNALYLGGSFTISVLFQIASTAAANCIISKCSGNSGPFQCYGASPTGDGAVFQFFLGSDSGFQNCAKVTGTTILINTWYYAHFTFDFNGGGGATATGTIYVNGIKNASGTGTASNYANDTQAILIGGRSDAGVHFGGKIAFVKLWNRALNPTEVIYDTIYPYGMLNTSRKLVLPASSIVALSISASDVITLVSGEQSTSGLYLITPQQFLNAYFAGFRDFLAFSDNITTAAQFFLKVSDSLALNDLLAQIVNPGAAVNINDVITLTDNLNTVVNTIAQPINVTISDIFTIIDSINVAGPNGLQITDNLILNDSIVIVLKTTITNYIRRYLNDVQ